MQSEQPDLSKLVDYNHEGWYALQHIKEGWWVGTEKGVLCYQEYDIARYANTVMWLREKKKRNFAIKVFTGANKMTGEYKPKRAAGPALAEYMKHK